MKKLIPVALCAFMLCSCSMFKKTEKTGCGTDGRNVGAEKLLKDDGKNNPDARAAAKAKYRIKGKN